MFKKKHCTFTSIHFPGAELNEFRREEFIPVGYYARVKRQIEGSTGPEGTPNAAPGAEPPHRADPPVRGPVSGRPAAPSGVSPPETEPSQPDTSDGSPGPQPPSPPLIPGAPSLVPRETTEEENLGSGEDDPILVPNGSAPTGPPAGSEPGAPVGPPTGSEPGPPSGGQAGTKHLNFFHFVKHCTLSNR